MNDFLETTDSDPFEADLLKRTFKDTNECKRRHAAQRREVHDGKCMSKVHLAKTRQIAHWTGSLL